MCNKDDSGAGPGRLPSPAVDPLTNIAEIVRTLISKISTLFEVIDLSFFVSGGTCMLAFVYMRHVYVGALPDLSGALTFCVAILGSYVMGLLCFAIGRWLRRTALGRPWTVDLNAHLADCLASHGLDAGEPARPYLRSPRSRKDALYPRLWAELRQDVSLKPSFELITSYWVRAAVYDGLIAALGFWGLAVYRTLDQERGFSTQPQAGYGALTLVVVGIIACAREASRSERYQVDEITATLAYAADKRRADQRAADRERERGEALEAPLLPSRSEAPELPSKGEPAEPPAKSEAGETALKRKKRPI